MNTLESAGGGVVRIISGECKGRRLSTLVGKVVRPTSDRAKETLFDILTDRIRGCTFLDLFSGTGSVGLEAASRGADKVFLVESNPKALKVLQKNVARCGFGERVEVFDSDSGKCLDRFYEAPRVFDLIFLDPPYSEEGAYRLILDVEEKGLLNREGRVIAEHDRHHEMPEAFGKLVRIRVKRVGDTCFSFYGVTVER